MKKIMSSKHGTKAPVKRQVLGVGITNASRDEVLEYVGAILAKKSKKLFIVTPNPEMITACQGNPALAQLLNGADLALCDGVGLLVAGQILGSRLKERIAGIDMMEDLCRYAVDQGLSIGLLGARPGVAERVAECLTQKYPGLDVVFAASEWSEEGFTQAAKYQVSSIKYNTERKHNTKYKIPNTYIDILFVAYGFPKQEQWISQHLVDLPISLAMGVGGSFDILSGDLSRAPFFMRMVGLEWLYRLIRQPWRWRRQLALVSFIALVVKTRLHPQRF